MNILRIVAIGVIIFSLISASWYVYHGELYFFTDVAGEFLLLKEINEKGIILIGRHSSGGLFHGALWAYINYPAYVVGNGNPIIVGWFWILLIAASSILNYFIAKALFKSSATGLIFTMLYALYWVPLAKAFIHPYGALFIFPLFFYLFVRYFETLKLKYLLWHVVLAGLLIQFDLAIGIPLTILSFVAVAYKVFRTKKFIHLASFLLLGIVLINFIIFNIRHDFIYFGFITKFLGGHTGDSPFTYYFLIQNKLKWMWVSIDIARNVPEKINFLLMILLFVFMVFQIRKNKFKTVYVSYIYFYVGFFILSFINKGPIMQWYILPLYLLTLLIVSSLITVKKYKIIVVLFFILLINQNINAAKLERVNVQTVSDTNEDSWKTLNKITSKVFEGKEKEFGYFIYSPDALGYEPKYAMHYQEKVHTDKIAHYFKKMPVTYLVIVPRPKNNIHMKHEWWRTNQVNITREPDEVITYPNEYVVEKYYLTEKERNVPFSPDIDTGFHFR